MILKAQDGCLRQTGSAFSDDVGTSDAIGLASAYLDQAKGRSGGWLG